MQGLARVDDDSGCTMSKKLKTWFKNADHDQDKKLSGTEAITLLEDIFAHTGAEIPKKGVSKATADYFAKNGKTGDFKVDLEEFADMLRNSKWWDILEKKGFIKAKKVVKETERAAIEQAFTDFDNESAGVIRKEELSSAFSSLGDALSKKWNPARIQDIVTKLDKGGFIPEDGDIDNDTFFMLCCRGPFKFFELKNTWWTKLGKKKKGTDASSSAAPSSHGADSDEEEEENATHPSKNHMLLRVAICYDPPKLLFEYQDKHRKIKHRVIRLHGCLPCGQQRITTRLYPRLKDLVPLERFTNLLTTLLNSAPTVTSSTVGEGGAAETAGEGGGEGGGGGGKKESGGEAEEGDPYEDDFHSSDGGDDDGGKPKAPNLQAVIEGKVDLNKVTNEELQEYKRQMDIEFKKNLKRPGDPGYVHDITKEFGEPTQDSGWDSSDDDF